LHPRRHAAVMVKIDVNCDLGEGFGAWTMGDDEALMPFVTSANIACGWHAGEPRVMRRTVRLAKRYGVRIGAHPGYPDLLGFGRRRMDLSFDEARDYLLYQIGALAAFARAEGMRLQHVKPHGALYNVAAGDRTLSDAIAEAVVHADPALIVVGPPESELLRAAQAAGLKVAREGFGDRAYNEDGSLVSRRLPGAVLTDPGAVADQASMMVEGRVRAMTGRTIEIQIDTICVHGDTPGAPEIARSLRARLERSGVRVVPMGERLGG
jgi:UPF0271 protein